MKYCQFSHASATYIRILVNVVYAILYSFGPFVFMILANFAIIYKFLKAKLRNRDAGTESTSQALSKSATRGTAMLLTVSLALKLSLVRHQLETT